MKFLLFSLILLSSCSLPPSKLDKLPGSKIDLSLDGCLDYCLRQHGIVFRYQINDELNQSHCVCASHFPD